MTRVLIAGRPKDDTVDVSVMYLRRVRAVGLVGAVAVAENEEDAAALADAFDALMLTGGADVYPARFGQTPNASNTYDGAQRDRSDELLFHAFRSRAKRILGICRGCQAINVYCGGTLHQHLPDAYEPVLWHARNIHGRHSVHINEGTTIARLVGAGDIRINSSHHQAIDRPGEGLTVSAAAPDGVIEAAEGKNILLVQWHPEWMGDEHNAIFSWLAGA